ncbi:MAG TPA: hypothetical protein VFD66_03345, partial [Verrucomicrobiae bacterium]|nr:hypothetical protein [Verrucomicrobiae bacterium]
LRASGHQVGVLINFGGPSLEWKRLVLTKDPASANLIRELRESSRIVLGCAEKTDVQAKALHMPGPFHLPAILKAIP